MRRHTTSMAERVWLKISQPTPTGCWEWTAGKNPDGYGIIWESRRDTQARHGVLVTHIMWWLATGHWPARGETVCHDCPEGDNPACVRNDTVDTYEVDGVIYEKRGHLWLGNQPANIRDMDLKGRRVNRMGDAHGTHLHPESVPRGETHPKAKLTAGIVLEARRLVRAGLATSKDLAILHGVAHQVMWRAVVGKTWAHL
jgi:hypothetical protein